MISQYQKMWEDFAKNKAKKYLDYKFNPKHQVGLTNFIREAVIYDFLQANRNDSILDAGCAAGRQLFMLSAKIKYGCGVDISQNFVDEAERFKKERGITNLSFSQSYLENLNFPDDFFDKIICAEVLEHVADPVKVLQELRRVLKPGGFLIVSVPNLNADGTLWGRFLRLLDIRKFIPLSSFSNEELSKHGDAHLREFRISTLKKMFINCEFIPLAATTASYLDGPFVEYLIKLPLHFSVSRKFIIQLENLLAKLKFFYGRHLIIKVKK